jgi:hypothetical protein
VNEAGILCFDRAEQREISLGLGLRIAALSKVMLGEMSPTQRLVTRARISECERLVRLIADNDASL